jgi:uncharacterized protein YijF (DUF1287 family)
LPAAPGPPVHVSQGTGVTARVVLRALVVRERDLQGLVDNAQRCGLDAPAFKGGQT